MPDKENTVYQKPDQYWYCMKGGVEFGPVSNKKYIEIVLEDLNNLQEESKDDLPNC